MKIKYLRYLDNYVGDYLLRIYSLISHYKYNFDKKRIEVDNKEMVFIKLLGGGSLIVAYPSLLSIKKHNADKKLILITTKQVLPFAKLINIFNEIVVIDEKGIGHSIIKLYDLISKKLRSSTIINLEIHSRIINLLVCLFKRCRKVIFNHRRNLDFNDTTIKALFYVKNTPVYKLYELISFYLESEEVSEEEIQASFKKNIKIDNYEFPFCEKRKNITINLNCSSLSYERMMRIEDWIKIILKFLNKKKMYNLLILGNAKAFAQGEELKLGLEKKLNVKDQVNIINCCGKFTLKESANLINNSCEFWGIDSSLLHIARILGIKTTAFFGPTNPNTLLRKFNYLEENIFYQNLQCSPCVHVNINSPCGGDNKCMRNFLD